MGEGPSWCWGESRLSYYSRQGPNGMELTISKTKGRLSRTTRIIDAWSTGISDRCASACNCFGSAICSRCQHTSMKSSSSNASICTSSMRSNVVKEEADIWLEV